ncbi:dihydropteroate synthase [Thermoleophilia bacterium SCSIO 60948]|nr:dihydropteroate synthase [Thermoleophilia bacterium SCSIO 60948]
MSATALDLTRHDRSPLGWRLPSGSLSFPPALGAGIVNVTTDSFFSGARSGTPDQAVSDGLRLVADGFDMLDVGAVAARSGPPVPAADEAARLVPAIAGLVAESGVPVLADTFSAEVASAVLEAGAAGINDISGGRDPALVDVVAQSGCAYVLMHIEGAPRVDREVRDHRDPVGEMRDWFERRLDELEAAGVAPEQVTLDPGFDFDLTVDDDVRVLRELPRLRELGRPLFVALSRKDFLGAIAAGSWDGRGGADAREAETLAATTIAVLGGADVLRLHDRSALDATRVADRIARG